MGRDVYTYTPGKKFYLIDLLTNWFEKCSRNNRITYLFLFQMNLVIFQNLIRMFLIFFYAFEIFETST